MYFGEKSSLVSKVESSAVNCDGILSTNRATGYGRKWAFLLVRREVECIGIDAEKVIVLLIGKRKISHPFFFLSFFSVTCFIPAQVGKVTFKLFTMMCC